MRKFAVAGERMHMRSEGIPRRLSVFMAECFAPASPSGDMGDEPIRVTEACQGLDIGYLGALMVADDEAAFHVFHAADVDTVLEACRRANLRVERVVPSVLIAAQAERPVAHAPGQIGP